MRKFPRNPGSRWFVLSGEDRMALVLLGVFFLLLVQAALIAEVGTGRFPRFALGSAGLGAGTAGVLLFLKATPYGQDRMVRALFLALKGLGWAVAAFAAVVGGLILLWGAALVLLVVLKVLLALLYCAMCLPFLLLFGLLGWNRRV